MKAAQSSQAELRTGMARSSSLVATAAGVEGADILEAEGPTSNSVQQKASQSRRWQHPHGSSHHTPASTKKVHVTTELERCTVIQ